MTEQEQQWLVGDNIQWMLRYVQDKAEIGNLNKISPRKLRLFACACCRAVWDGVACGKCHGKGMVDAGWEMPGTAVRCPVCHGTGRTGGLTDPRSRRAVEVAERYADGEATNDEMWTAQQFASSAIADRARHSPGMGWPDLLASHVAIPDTIEFGTYFERQEGPPDAVTQAALLRDICGNPWRPVTSHHTYRSRRKPTRRLPPGAHPMVPVLEEFDELRLPLPWFEAILSWNDCTVPRIAQAIYTERAFDRMPILADALEDAGCGDVEILSHCRGLETVVESVDKVLGQRCPKCGDAGFWRRGVRFDHEKMCGKAECGEVWEPRTSVTEYMPRIIPLRSPHVRGCHVLDMFLGKE